MTYAFPLDPREILDVPAEASLQDIQAAYRTKSKKHHPDAGGDEWAFRVLNRAYELMCTARVLGHAAVEMERDETPEAPENPFGPIRPRAETADDTRVRPGVRDRGLPPEKLVGIEHLLIRFELDGPAGLLMSSPEDRNLSCTLQVEWPARDRSGAETPAPAEPKTLKLLADIFQTVQRKTRARTGHSEVQDGRFRGWITYPSALQADQGFKAFHEALEKKGMGVVQTIRDVTIPREWRG